MERTYEARAYKTLGQNEHQTDWIRELVAKYETTDKSDLLRWVIAIAERHGADGDETVDWIEAWSDDPDDAWSLNEEATADGTMTIRRELEEVTV